MPALSLLEKTELRRIIDRQWAPYLHPHEFVCLSFIFTVTIEWGRLQEKLKFEHFTDGLGYAGGVGIARISVRRALDNLEQMEALWRKRTPYGYIYGINFRWKPNMIAVPKHANRLQQKAGPGLAEPKKQKESAQIDHSRLLNESTLYTKGHSFKNHTSSPLRADALGVELSSEKKGQDSRTVRLTTQATIDAARAKTKLARDQAKASGRVNLEKVWAVAFRETFPEAPLPAWSGRNQGNAAQFVKTNPHTAKVDGPGLLDWIVRSWRLIISARFSWMTESPAPDLPDTGFLIRWKDRFYEAWAERERLRGDLNVSGRDRRVRRLMHGGLSHEEATKQADEAVEIAGERAKLAESQRRLNEVLRHSEQRHRQAATPERFQRPVRERPVREQPVQPQSNTGGFGSLPGGYDDF